MYDPEFNLWVEGLMKQFYTATGNIRNMVGEDHPLAKLCESFDDALGAIEQMRNDYDNCFDEAECKVMSKDIRKAINDIAGLWKQVAEIYENK